MKKMKKMKKMNKRVFTCVLMLVMMFAMYTNAFACKNWSTPVQNDKTEKCAESIKTSTGYKHVDVRVDAFYYADEQMKDAVNGKVSNVSVVLFVTGDTATTGEKVEMKNTTELDVNVGNNTYEYQSVKGHTSGTMSFGTDAAINVTCDLEFENGIKLTQYTKTIKTTLENNYCKGQTTGNYGFDAVIDYEDIKDAVEDVVEQTQAPTSTEKPAEIIDEKVPETVVTKAPEATKEAVVTKVPEATKEAEISKAPEETKIADEATPKTGDESNITIFIIIGAVAVIGMIVAVVVVIINNKKK